ncbi:MAG: serine hydrolase domain-containing protein, partial [Pelobium sp.]
MNKLIQLLFITMMMNTAKSQTPGQIKQIDSLMQSANLRGVFNGNILVAQKDKIIYKKSWGFADASKNKLLNIDLLFDIGSISKEFNGVSIMLLKEQGKLKLDDPISKFLPDLPEWSKNVQIKHLINYTSGIPNFVAQSDETDEELMDYLKNLKALSFEPGTAYIYAHGNVYLQKRIIEKISGLSYANFVSKYILKPNNMSHTIIDADLSSPDVAKAFDNEFKPTSFIQVTTGFPRISINDLYQFIRSLENFKIMNQESFNQLSDNFPGGESSLGSTVFENERLKSHRHQGSNSGYEALIYTDHILGIDVIIETNNQNFKVDAIKNAIFAILQNQTYTVPKKSVYLDIRDKVL